MSCHKGGARSPWLSLWPLAALGLVLTSCASAPGARLWTSASFPPQRVMASGDYQGFRRENERQLERCGGWTQCDVALFNLVFVYAYPASPYRNAYRARQFVEELQRQYPDSPWAAQGQMLMAFVHERVSAEEVQQRLRFEIRSRETMIRKLRSQLHRSREIDVEIEEKERELLR
jgi:hypothetical protein